MPIRGIPADRLSRRARMLIAVLLVVVWSTWRAGWSTIVNVDGWPAFARFWASAVRPEVSSDFLSLTWDATLRTLAFALLGTAVALSVGLAGAPLLSERTVGARRLRRVATICAALDWVQHDRTQAPVITACDAMQVAAVARMISGYSPQAGAK